MGHEKEVVLAVDDKETNLVLLTGMLESEGYRVVTAIDGVKAWEILESNRHDFQTVLLDRVMPNMDGLEVLQKLKAHPRFKFIPVIMQTAANATNEVLEGIEAGAYYYLTKPYQKKILVGIVQAAIRDYATHQQLQQELQQAGRTWSFLQSGIFSFRTLKEARELGPLLANGCPDPGRIILGLSEVLVNAVEHGNLGISYEEKIDWMNKANWIQKSSGASTCQKMPTNMSKSRLSDVTMRSKLSLPIRVRGSTGNRI